MLVNFSYLWGVVCGGEASGLGHGIGSGFVWRG